MRKLRIVGVAMIVASLLSLAALPQDASAAKIAVKYGDRLQPLVGKRFGIAPDRAFVQQFAKGDYELVAVGVDYAEFHSDDSQVLVPLSTLRVELLK
jgi:hypothetical protein